MKELAGHGLGREVLFLIVRMRLRQALMKRNPLLPTPDDAAWAQKLFGCYPAIMIQFFYFRLIRKMVYSAEMFERQRDLSDAEFLHLPLDKMRRWDQMNRTRYISNRDFLTHHLLGPHGDRALMANSVEGRYPFLDRAVQEFLVAVPPDIKTTWRTDKYLLRRAMADRLPRHVIHHRKNPFLTSVGTPFVGDDATEYLRHLLSPDKLLEFGYFDPAKVQQIMDSLGSIKQSLSHDRKESLRPERSVVQRTGLGMALNFVVTTQVLADLVSRGEFSRR